MIDKNDLLEWWAEMGEGRGRERSGEGRKRGGKWECTKK